MPWQYFQRTLPKVVATQECVKFPKEGRHPTVLHGLKFQKYKKKGNNEDMNTKENKPEEVKCASANNGSDVISMCIVLVQFKSKDASRTVYTFALMDCCTQDTFILHQ